MATKHFLIAALLVSIIAGCAGRRNKIMKWNSAEMLCAASHHACLRIPRKQLPDDDLRTEMCFNCYAETCNTDMCTAKWCLDNGATGTNGCRSSRRGVSDKYVTWTRDIRNCVSAHAACKALPKNNWMRPTMCHICGEVCQVNKWRNCWKRWCGSNKDYCDKALL